MKREATCAAPSVPNLADNDVPTFDFRRVLLPEGSAHGHSHALRFTSPEWVFERKVNGIRLLAFRRAARPSAFPQPAAAELSVRVAAVAGSRAGGSCTSS